MNTVESLKKLYKTMAGKDWPYDPNPTDAEVIDKIAADATSGGSGGSGSAGRVIDLDALPVVTEYMVWQYETGLTVKDFLGAAIARGDDFFENVVRAEALRSGSIELLAVMAVENGDDISLSPQVYSYNPNTGNISAGSGK